MQETFLKAYRAIDGFTGAASLGTWLCRICLNVCYDLARKRQAEAARTAALEPPRSHHLGLRLQLEDALRRIPAPHRTVFLLFAVEGMRHAEIAAILEIPEGTSKSWLFEAKRGLQRLLTETRT